MAYSILSPYLVPETLTKTKKVNLGDGFILARVKQHLGAGGCQAVFSTRAPLSAEDIRTINQTNALIIAGANQLNDYYTIVPGGTLDLFKQITVPIIPFGVGVRGVATDKSKMSEETKAMLREMHTRISQSSWRCFRTVAYLERELPELAGKFVMTGCPVIYDEPLLSGKPFTTTSNKIAITITERGDWWEREKTTVDFVVKRFPEAKLFLVLHQDYSDESIGEKIGRFFGQTQHTAPTFYRYAELLGITVVKPPDADACMKFYEDCDLHIGSRLHAHVYCLSRAKRSFLVPVDERSAGFADYLKFPLLDYRDIERDLGYDFEVYRSNARTHFETMRRFIENLKPTL